MRDAERHDPVGRRARDVLRPASAIVPWRARSRPEIVLQRGRLARAVRADQRDQLARAPLSSDTPLSARMLP